METSREPPAHGDDKTEVSGDTEVTPPNTVLVRWMGDLLLLDAWNVAGNKLRSVPSLINEAMAHFRLSGSVKRYRLAVHELVDDRPALLYLGLSALRFIENGRVLDLVEIDESAEPPFTAGKSRCRNDQDSATDTWETAPLAGESSYHSPDHSTTSSSVGDAAHGYWSDSTSDGASSRRSSNLHLEVWRRRGRQGNFGSHSEPPSRVSRHGGHLPQSKSHATLADAEARETSTAGSGRSKGHSSYRAAGCHLGDQTSRERESTEAQAGSVLEEESSSTRSTAANSIPRHIETGTTYDFRDHRVLPRPALSRPVTPLPSPRDDHSHESRPHTVSRPLSYASELSRRTGQASRRKYVDDDPWLGSEGAEKWQHIGLDKQHVSQAQRNKSFDRLRTGHPEAGASESLLRELKHVCLG